jgi:hypothetical protein
MVMGGRSCAKESEAARMKSAAIVLIIGVSRWSTQFTRVA